jgi:hypothetical protein
MYISYVPRSALVSNIGELGSEFIPDRGLFLPLLEHSDTHSALESAKAGILFEFLSC